MTRKNLSLIVMTLLYLGCLGSLIIAIVVSPQGDLTGPSKMWLGVSAVFIVAVIVYMKLDIRRTRREHLVLARALEERRARLCGEIPVLVASEGIRMVCSVCGFHENLGKSPTILEVSSSQANHDSREIR